MTRVWGIALMVAVGLLFAGESQAKTAPHRVKCRAGYVRRTVWVPERRHGRIVRTYGLIVYTRVQRCVKVKKPGPGTTPTTWPTLTPPFTPIGSTPPFSSPPPPPPPPPPGAPANTAPPTVSGTATESDTLSASTGTWTNGPTSYGYQWQRCNTSGGSCSPTAVATASYPLTNADVGSTIRVSVTASNAAGSGSATSAATGTVGSGASSGDPVAVAVGDIACSPVIPNPDGSPCKQSATEAVAERQHPSDVLVLGDNQYDAGSYSEYTGPLAYNATWGVFNPIVHPVPGNHEYGTSGAAGYFQYFGNNGVTTGVESNPTGGYYSFNVGSSWHIIALNSDCSDSGCVDGTYGSTSTAQLTWLQSDLAQNTRPCVLAMWHHPLVSSGWTYGSFGVAPLWNALYSAHADVVLNGHDHLYERYAQLGLAAQNANGVPTAPLDSNGIREFVVGTGGESLNGLSSMGAQPQASDSQFGVLALTLHASSYSWSFVNTSGNSLDSGTTVCNSKGSGASAALAREAKAHRVLAFSAPPLVLDARPLGSSLASILKRGLPVAVHLSRAADVTVTVSVRRGTYLQRIASFYETESQISKPDSEIFLHLPARRLAALGGVTLVLKFLAVDSAAHRRVLTTNVSLGNG